MTKRTDLSARFKKYGICLLFVLNAAHQLCELFLPRIRTADAQCDRPCMTYHFSADPDKFLPECVHPHTDDAWHVLCLLIQEQMIHIVCPCLDQKFELVGQKLWMRQCAGTKIVLELFSEIFRISSLFVKAQDMARTPFYTVGHDRIDFWK